LNTIVYVQSNAVLVIEPGTVVKGGTNAANLVSKTGIPNLVSALWVTRGGKLYATGTVAKPIIFTMEGDDVNDPNDIPPTMTGKWGGIVMMGQATINSAQYGPGDVATPVYDRYEGVTDNGPNGEHLFGGTNDLDSSGALRYVSIRHTGNQFATDKELNALTMGGIGSGTVIEYVEVFAGSDDGFEWWGGVCNSKYLVAAFMEDDDFDTDQGYRGTNQFWFGIKSPWSVASADCRGIESDGDIAPVPSAAQNGPHGDRLPWSTWTVHNATLIGRGASVTASDRRVAWNTRDESAGSMYNSVVAAWDRGIKLDTDGRHFYVTNVQADVKNNVWQVNTSGDTTGSDFLFTDVLRSNSVVSAGLGSISYTNDSVLNPRPQPGSAALTNVLAGAPVTTSYRGAFKPNDSWADGWSFISKAGYLAYSKPELTIQPAGANVQITCLGFPGKTYQLQSTTSLNPLVTWGNEGAAQAGTGGTLTFTVSATGNKYFQVVAY
jgi:hypothetical protein